jgi:glutamate formiminotransferase/glutamate formiminotransferase/formiminotetrahydrofolate cyclodeaminase
VEGPVIECVPNFSEGRDPATVEAIVGAIASVDGAVVLAHERDPDHNRAVVTFAGPPEAVREAAVRGVAEAVARIDLRRHSGVHPRIGVADVIPFVPVSGATLEETVEIAHAAGAEIWERLRVPVYFYEAAALRPECRPLENVRRGGLAPDLGGPAPHPSAGCSVVGARRFLIAFNVDLDSTDLAAARAVARSVRASNGGLPAVKAIGLPLASRGIVQVSMNLTDFETTGVYEAFEAVRQGAAARGINVRAAELIGLVPRKAIEGGDPATLKFIDFGPHRILEDCIEHALAGHRTK